MGRGGKCEQLTTEDADEIFFPGRGGKVGKAKAFCSDCPFRSDCLNEAIYNKLEGFWAGTTDQERAGMREFLGVVTRGVNVDEYLPASVTGSRRRVLRKIEDTAAFYSYLDEVTEPTEEDLIAAIS